MTEYLSLENAYSTLVDYNNNFLNMMDVPLNPERDYAEKNTDGCVMRMAKTATPLSPPIHLLEELQEDATPKKLTTLMYQSRLNLTHNPDCRHNRLMVITSGRYEGQLNAKAKPTVTANLGHLTLYRVRPKRGGKQLPYPIIRATVGHDVILRTPEAVRYSVRPDYPEAVNIQTMDELHTFLGWVTLKIEEAAQHNQFRDATRYVESSRYYNR